MTIDGRTWMYADHDLRGRPKPLGWEPVEYRDRTLEFQTRGGRRGYRAVQVRGRTLHDGAAPVATISCEILIVYLLDVFRSFEEMEAPDIVQPVERWHALAERYASELGRVWLDAEEERTGARAELIDCWRWAEAWRVEKRRVARAEAVRPLFAQAVVHLDARDYDEAAGIWARSGSPLTTDEFASTLAAVSPPPLTTDDFMANARATLPMRRR